MFLKIAKDKVKYVAILNGEPILIRVDELSNNGDLMTVKTSMFVESEYLEDPNTAKKGHIVNINNTFIVDPVEAYQGYYDTIALRLVKDKLIQQLNLNPEDITFLAEIEWRNPAQSIRLTIPMEQVIENPFYRGLMQVLISANTIYYKSGDNYILYLAYILPEHRAILDSDPNLIIED